MRREAVVAGATAAGAAAGLVAALLSGGSQQATTTLSVARGASLIASETVAAFAGSSAVADNVGQALHVPAGAVQRRLRVRAIRGTALLELRYSDPSSTRATQGAQEAASVLTVLVPTRFPGLAVAVVDPAHAHAVGAPLARDAGLGAVAGLLAGAFVLLRPRRGARAQGGPGPTAAPAPAPPPPAPEPVPPPPAPEPAPPAAPEAAPPAEPAWVAELRSALAAHGREFGDDRVAEWGAYIDAFAAQAVDGELPPHLRSICADVFEPLLLRARA